MSGLLGMPVDSPAPVENPSVFKFVDSFYGRPEYDTLKKFAESTRQMDSQSLQSIIKQYSGSKSYLDQTLGKLATAELESRRPLVQGAGLLHAVR